MSIICYYVSAALATVPMIEASPDVIFDPASRPPGVEVIDVDKAYEALAWLSSPLKRAETEHQTRLIREPNWNVTEARASVAALDAIPMDDSLAALEGRTDDRNESIDFGMGAAAFFPPARVRELSTSLNGLSEEDLRAQANFETMDEQDVQPGNWVIEGEDILSSYLIPGFRRLQRFYGSAAAQDQAVLVVCV